MTPRPAYRITQPGPPTGRFICPACGTRGGSKTITRGSFLVELALWCCFLIPGVIYSLWRLSAKVKVCAACRNPGVVPVNSPRGRELVAHFQQ